MPTERVSIALLARVRCSAVAVCLAIPAASFSASRLVFLSSKLSAECDTGGRGQLCHSLLFLSHPLGPLLCLDVVAIGTYPASQELLVHRSTVPP